LQRTSAPSLKHLREFRIKGDLDVAEGQILKADVFSAGEYVD